MATKAEVIDQLTSLGIQHDPNALKADLEALLPVVESPTIEAPVVEDAAPDQFPPVQNMEFSSADVTRETPDATSVTAHDPHGHPHRTFSHDVHGERFREIAEQYVSGRPGWSLK